jgi:hypothetical protein
MNANGYIFCQQELVQRYIFKLKLLQMNNIYSVYILNFRCNFGCFLNPKFSGVILIVKLNLYGV